MPNNLPKPGDILNKSSLPNPGDILTPVKKKESTSKDTGSLLKPADLLSSLVTKSKKEQKPSASSASGKPKEEVFTGYPGKEEKRYKLDNSTGVPVWKEEVLSEKVVNGKKSLEFQDKPITNSARVVSLNKQFNKNASTDVNDNVFTGYPGKELNEYKIENNTWKRRLPGETKWVDLNQKNTIDALNNQFKKDVKYSTAKAKFDLLTEDEDAESKRDLDGKLTLVNSKLIGGEEEGAVKKLKEQFPLFKFVEQGMLTDEILVIAPNNKEIKISLDNWTHDDDLNQSSSLREFIKANSASSLNTKEEKMLEAQRYEDQFKIKPVDVKIKLGEGVGDGAQLMDMSGSGTSIPVPEKDIMTANIDAQLARSEYFKERKETFQEINDKHRQAISTTGSIDNKDVRNAYANLNNDTTIAKSLGSYMNDIADKNKSINKEYESLKEYSDQIKDKVAAGEISEEDFKNIYVPKIEQDIANIEKRSSSLNDDVITATANENSINKSIAENLIINSSKGSVGGGISNNLVTGLTDILRIGAGIAGAKSEDTKALQKELVQQIVGSGTTEEYMASEDRSALTKTLFSLSKSMGQLATGSVAGKLATSVGAGAGAVNLASTVPFYAGGYYEMRDQFEGPEFADVSDAEKVLMSTLYGTASGILEKYGLTKSLSKTPMGKGLTNTIIKAAFKDIPKNASAKMIEVSIENSIKKQLVARGANTVGAYIVEASTEAAQELAQVGLQEAFEVVKGNNYFENGTGWDIASRAWEAAYLGGLGGAVMGTVSQSYGMFKDRKKINNIDSVELMRLTYNDANMRDLMLTNIKAKIINKEITPKEGKDMFDAVKNTAAILDKLPDSLSDEQTLNSVNLLVERSNIEKEIAGKDENLVATQKARVVEINNELKNISEDATKESNIQEVTAEGGISEYQGAGEGQQEVGVGEGIQRDTTVDETNLGDSNIPGQVQEEVTAKQAEFNSIQAEAIKKTDELQAQGLTNEEIQNNPEFLSIRDRMDAAQAELDALKLTTNVKADIEKRRQEELDKDENQPFDFYPRIDLREADTETKNKFYENERKNKEQSEKINKINAKYDAELVALNQPVAKPAQQAESQSLTTEQVDQQAEATQATIEQEVEAIGQLLSGTDQEIDQKASTIVNKKISKAVARAAKAVSKVIPGTKFIIHDTDASYRAATKEKGMSQSSNGEFNPKTNTIHINGTKANSRTVAHEVFHAILLNKVKTDANASATTKRMVQSIASKIDNNPELKKKLEGFISNYDENIQNEEKIAELVGMLAENYNSFSTNVKDIITRWIDKLAKMLNLDPFNRNETYDILNTIARKVAKGTVIKEADVEILGGDSEVGTFNIPDARKQNIVKKSPSVANDTRDFIKEFVQDVDIREFNGSKFVTNMYDYTNAGITDLGNGFTINLLGGKNYVPLMMSINNKKIGDVSNLAAFNTKAQAETFIRNVEKSGSNLFAPHSGTKSQSWQFQQHTFAELVNLVLDKNILTNRELIDTFNNTIQNNAALKNKFNTFKKRYGKDINNFDTFESNPKEIVNLLDIENNLSPDIRKALNNSIASNKKFQAAIGVKNKEEFYDRIMDPLNKGIEGGEIMSVVKFDPTTFEIVKTLPSKEDHHPSFGWTVLAKIEAVYQPTEFHKSANITDTYTKYNIAGEEISRKSEEPGFEQKNVASSAGAIPKVAEFKIEDEVAAIEDLFASRKQKTIKVYHGGNVKDLSNINKDNPLFVSEDKNQAEEYTKENKGTVSSFEVNDDGIANEDTVYELINKLGLKSKEEGWDINDLNLFELLDPIFSTSLSNKDIIKVYSELEKEELGGIRFTDTNIKTLKQDIQNIVIFNTDLVREGKSTRKQITDEVTGIEESMEPRKQKPLSINEIVNKTRNKGFSDAGISAYLKKQGYTQSQIDSAMVGPSAGTINIDDIFAASDQEIKDKLRKKSIKGFFRSLIKTTIERQTEIKRALSGIKNKRAKLAMSKLITKAGASGLASLRFKRVSKEIYGGLKERQIKVLDKIIYARRIISINENRTKRGLNPYRGMGGYSEVNAQADLDRIEQEIGTVKFDDLNNRAKKYFDVFKDNLKKLKESGRINQETYDNLSEIEYSPIATIKYIISDNVDIDDMEREAARLGISKQDINKLTDSNENGIITDSRFLLAMNISAVESRAFENGMLNDVVEAMKTATTIEKDALSKYVIFDNPIIGKFKDGRPKRKYDDQPLPSGFRKVHYFKDGVDLYMVVRDDIARQLLDVKNSKLVANIEETAKNVPVIGTVLKHIVLTPGRILRFMATGGNPLFIFGNVAVDLTNATFNTNVYSWFKPYALVQAGAGFTKNFLKKAVTSDTLNKSYNEFAEHGGLMDFLSNEGMRSLNDLKPGFKIFTPIHKLMMMYGTVMSYIGETSEVATRLAVYDKTKKNLIAEFKKENGVDPTTEQLDDMMWEAAREARELIDFNQGGSWAKEADVIMPYLNASLQGFRKPIEYAKNNPAAFALSYVQFAGMAAGVATMSIAYAMSAFGGDDEEEKKKKVRKALDSISEHEKAMYHIIFTGKIDKDGELEYFRIKKLPVASIATTWAEQIMYRHLLGAEFDDATFEESISKSIPLSISDIQSKNPVVAGLLTYYYDEDTFTGEKVSKGPRDKEILATAEGINDPNVEGFYKVIAPVFGLSPIRSKAALEKIITNQSTNPTINAFYAAMNGIFDGNTTFAKEFMTAGTKMKESAGKKLIRYTNESVIKYKKIDASEKERLVINTDVYLKDSEMKAKIKETYKDGKTLTVGQLQDMVEKNFEPRDHERYIQKYYTYTQTINTNPVLLDIIYEKDPSIQALLINDTYGSNLDREEMKELVDIMSRSRIKIPKSAWYIYEEKYKNRK
jgi:hypothetical protein